MHSTSLVNSHTSQDGSSATLLGQTPLRGRALLDNPFYNRDLAFTQEERAALGLEGLLPAAVQTLTEQVAIARAQVMSYERPIDRFVALAELEARNVVLYY